LPELPEVEALRRSLDESLSLAPIEHAGPAHLATLKTAEPPLRALAGRRLAGARRRGKRLLFPTDDGELVLVVHLMSAGRLRLLAAQKRAPAAPAFQLSFEGGARLILTEPGKRKRAGVWLLTPELVEKELAHLGPDALGLEPALLARLCKGERRRLHGFLRDQRVLAGIGRAWANEILHTARLSPFALAGELDGEALGRLAGAISSELERGIQLREQGLSNDDVYRVHGKLGQACHVCQTPIAQVAFEEHTIYYCPRCQTGGRKLADRRLSRLLR
jgi:formamidopyrimidine-DNA glycosylase